MQSDEFRVTQLFPRVALVSLRLGAGEGGANGSGTGGGETVTPGRRGKQKYGLIDVCCICVARRAPSSQCNISPRARPRRAGTTAAPPPGVLCARSSGGAHGCRGPSGAYDTAKGTRRFSGLREQRHRGRVTRGAGSRRGEAARVVPQLVCGVGREGSSQRHALAGVQLMIGGSPCGPGVASMRQAGYRSSPQRRPA